LVIAFPVSACSLAKGDGEALSSGTNAIRGIGVHIGVIILDPQS